MTTEHYVHGYSPRESERLNDQATILSELLHHDTLYPPGAHVLEAGCGVGAQTVFLTKNSPQTHFTCIDLSDESVEKAKQAYERQGMGIAEFQQAGIFDLPFADASFDHVFVCFVLEHLPNPQEALTCLKRVIKPGGTITVIEGDHGSAYFHPHSDYAMKAIQCLIDLQARNGGDSLIGRQLYPLVQSAGFRDVRVTPRVVYADAGRPHVVVGFTRNTFTAMVEGVAKDAVAAGMITQADWDRGMTDLHRTAEPDGTFNYTFFKAVGVR